MNLTDEEIRIKVAEAMGARWHSVLTGPQSEKLVLAFSQWTNLGPSRWGLSDGRILSPQISNYPEDLNATHEMEAALEWTEFADYQTKLEKVVQSEWTERSRFPCHREFATARQRSIAFLKTKGLIP